MPFYQVRDDITRMKVDAVVNAANNELLMGGGVCGAIFRAAGPEQMQAACRPLAPLATGKAVITPGFALPANYVIHTPGPIYRPHVDGLDELLAASYTNSLMLAHDYECERIAFPLISSGIYGYPKAKALHIAVTAILSFLQEHDMTVYLSIFDRELSETSERRLREIDRHLKKHYRPAEASATPRGTFRMLRPADAAVPEASASTNALTSLEEQIANLDESFSKTLLRLIDQKGYTDVEVYKKANIDRKLFSKIRNAPSYMPSKRTAVAFAVALELSAEETHDLLKRAGFTLSQSQKFDVIIDYFIRNGIYDIFRINDVLFRYDQPLLGV